MTSFDPRRNVHSSEAASVRDSVSRLADSTLLDLYRAASRKADSTGDVSRSKQVEAVTRWALSSSKGRQSLATRRRADRDRQRKHRGGDTR